MLVKSIKAVLQSGYQFRQLHEMPAALAMPRKVTLASIARMNFIADRYLPNPVQLLGYNVSYADAAQLRYLYREIFMYSEPIFSTRQSDIHLLSTAAATSAYPSYSSNGCIQEPKSLGSNLTRTHLQFCSGT